MQTKKIRVRKNEVWLRGKGISDPAYLKTFKKSLPIANRFIIEKYGDDGRFVCDNTSYIIHPAFRGSYFYSSGVIKLSCIFADRKYDGVSRKTKISPIEVGGLVSMRYYERKTVGMKAPAGFRVPTDVYYTSVLIHELTHAVQKLQRRSMSEVETTQNEFEYLACYHNEYYKKLVRI